MCPSNSPKTNLDNKSLEPEMLGTQKKVVEEALLLLKSVLGDDPTGHDYWHSYRAWKTALKIAQEEGVKDENSLLKIELASVLHDIFDYKLDTDWTAEKLEEWLVERTNEKIAEEIIYIIQNISFKGAGVKDSISSIEGMIVQDADRLDALGAIGIARAFAIGAYKFKRPIHDPEMSPTFHPDEASYITRSKTKDSTINHFHEKLFLLKDRMKTKTGRRIAEGREKYMKEFVERFLQEWEGKL